MVRYREVDPDTIDAYDQAAALAEVQPPVSAYAQGPRSVSRGVTPTYAEMVEFENNPTASEGVSHSGRIWHRFGLTPTRYHQHLNRMLNDPEALQLDPVLIHRLTARRDKQIAWRASRTFK